MGREQEDDGALRGEQAASPLRSVTDWKRDVGIGWHPLLGELHAELEQVRPGYKTLQVKEKWGVLTVYIEHCTSEITPILVRYMNRSAEICEECGAPGRIHKGRRWLRTLCDEHEAARHRPVV